MGKKISGMFLVLLCCVGCAGHSSYMKPAAVLKQPTADKALVRFMRPSGYGYVINFNVLDGEKVIGNSVAKSQFDYLAEPGKHLFIATAENKSFLEADLQAGKTYYVITKVSMGAWTARVAFVPVTQGSKFWDKVKGYETTLTVVEPDTDALLKWETANKGGIRKLVDTYEMVYKSKGPVPTLSLTDGR